MEGEYIFFESTTMMTSFLSELLKLEENVIFLNRDSVKSQISMGGVKKIKTILPKDRSYDKIHIFDESCKYISSAIIVETLDMTADQIAIVESSGIVATDYNAVILEMDDNNIIDFNLDDYLSSHPSTIKQPDPTPGGGKSMFEIYLNNTDLKNNIFKDVNNDNKAEFDIMYNIHDMIDTISNMGENNKKLYVQSSIVKNEPLTVLRINGKSYVSFDDDYRRIISYDESHNMLDIQPLLSHGGFTSRSIASVYTYTFPEDMQMRERFVQMLSILKGYDEEINTKLEKKGKENVYRVLFTNADNVVSVLKSNAYVEPYGDVRFTKVDECVYLPTII